MPSSGIFSARPMPRQRPVFNPDVGYYVPFDPFPAQRYAKIMQISKVRHPNPFLINKGHFNRT